MGPEARLGGAEHDQSFASRQVVIGHGVKGPENGKTMRGSGVLKISVLCHLVRGVTRGTVVRINDPAP